MLNHYQRRILAEAAKHGGANISVPEQMAEAANAHQFRVGDAVQTTYNGKSVRGVVVKVGKDALMIDIGSRKYDIAKHKDEVRYLPNVKIEPTLQDESVEEETVTEARKMGKRQLRKAVDDVFNKHFNGVPVPLMKLVAIFKEIEAAIVSGADPEKAMAEIKKKHGIAEEVEVTEADDKIKLVREMGSQTLYQYGSEYYIVSSSSMAGETAIFRGDSSGKPKSYESLWSERKMVDHDAAIKDFVKYKFKKDAVVESTEITEEPALMGGEAAPTIFGWGKHQFESKFRELLTRMGFERGIVHMKTEGKVMKIYFANAAKARDFVIAFNGIARRRSMDSVASVATQFDKIKAPMGTAAIVTLDLTMVRGESLDLDGMALCEWFIQEAIKVSAANIKKMLRLSMWMPSTKIVTRVIFDINGIDGNRIKEVFGKPTKTQGNQSFWAFEKTVGVTPFLMTVEVDGNRGFVSVSDPKDRYTNGQIRSMFASMGIQLAEEFVLGDMLTEGYEGKIVMYLEDGGFKKGDAWFENGILYVASRNLIAKAKTILNKHTDIYKLPEIRLEEGFVEMTEEDHGLRTDFNHPKGKVVLDKKGKVVAVYRTERAARKHAVTGKPVREEADPLTEGGVKSVIADFMYSLPKEAITELKTVMKIKSLQKRFAMINKTLKKHGVAVDQMKLLGSYAANVINDYFNTFHGESVEEERQSALTTVGYALVVDNKIIYRGSKQQCLKKAKEHGGLKLGKVFVTLTPKNIGQPWKEEVEESVEVNESVKPKLITPKEMADYKVKKVLAVGTKPNNESIVATCEWGKKKFVQLEKMGKTSGINHIVQATFFDTEKEAMDEMRDRGFKIHA